tara:strand:+ start:436 stop:594 length:159 start_codon:yes stop_codon:yes gene_type:complete
MATPKEVSRSPVKPANKSKGGPKKPLTLEKKLSDTKARMNKIVEGNDPGYHL